MKYSSIFCLMAAAITLMFCDTLAAQCGGCGKAAGCGASFVDNASYAMGAHGYHPSNCYAHSGHGNHARIIHGWNSLQGSAYPWHGSYNYWRYGVPTALVVPPTAAFQTEYNWGVSQTRSLPIYHQFGRDYPGPGPGVPGMNTPYWPSSTSQFGIYPVRGPW